MEKYYLYRHIRLDKNEPFYIGIGTKSKQDKKDFTYSRAYVTKDRNSIWKGITSRTNYEVEILLESDDYEFIKEKEKEFIKLYGRIDLKTGSLCNLTIGGDGAVGLIHTKETREKLRKVNLGKKMSNETKAKLSNSKKGKASYRPNYKMSDELNIKLKKINSNRYRSPEEREKQGMHMRKPVLLFNLNMELIEKFESGAAISRYFGLKSGNIYNYINREKPYKSFYLKYKEC